MGATVAVASLLLPACAVDEGVAVVTGSAEPSSASSVVPSLAAEVVQYRRDAQRDVVQVKVTNLGEAPAHVTHVRLESDTFADPLEADKDSTIGPGLSADLTVPLAEPACDGPADPAPAVAHLTLGDGTGGSDVVTVETEQQAPGADVLATVRDERCAVLAVTDVVALTVTPGWTDAGPVGGEPALRGTLDVTPLPAAPDLTVWVEGATTLFTVAGRSTATLPAGGAEPVALDVVLTVTRCDAHAVAEDKKGYLLPVRVAVGGAEPVLVEVPVPVPERAPLQDLIDRTCS